MSAMLRAFVEEKQLKELYDVTRLMLNYVRFWQKLHFDTI